MKKCGAKIPKYVIYIYIFITRLTSDMNRPVCISPITLTSQWVRWRLISPAYRLFAQTVCSGADQRKHQSTASLAFGRGIHRWPVDSPRKGPVTRNMLPFDEVIMMMLANMLAPSRGQTSATTVMTQLWLLGHVTNITQLFFFGRTLRMNYHWCFCLIKTCFSLVIEYVLERVLPSHLSPDCCVQT